MSNVIRVGSAPSLKLPDLTNPAKAEEIATGKGAIGSNGEIIVGTRSSVVTSEWLPLFPKLREVMTRAYGTMFDFSIVFETVPRVVLFRLIYTDSSFDYCYLYINVNLESNYSMQTGQPDVRTVWLNVSLSGKTISGSVFCQRDDVSDADVDYLAIY